MADPSVLRDTWEPGWRPPSSTATAWHLGPSLKRQDAATPPATETTFVHTRAEVWSAQPKPRFHMGRQGAAQPR